MDWTRRSTGMRGIPGTHKAQGVHQAHSQPLMAPSGFAQPLTVSRLRAKKASPQRFRIDPPRLDPPNALQCNAMQYNAIQRNAMQCVAMRCNTPRRSNRLDPGGECRQPDAGRAEGFRECGSTGTPRDSGTPGRPARGQLLGLDPRPRARASTRPLRCSRSAAGAASASDQQKGPRFRGALGLDCEPCDSGLVGS